MKQTNHSQNAGFSLLELIIAMVVMLIMLGIVSSLLTQSFGIRARESRRTDALTSAQAAINVMSREISNAGFGIYEDSITQRPSNGIIIADSGPNKIHFRANVENVGPNPLPTNSTVLSTNQSGEDVTYFFDSATDSVVRYDPNGTIPTSVVVNRISNVTFQYFNYAGSNSTPTETTVPTIDTARIRITVTVQLEPVVGQPNNQTITFTSDVNLRNSNYMLNQY
jgi:prepilin-type N-terminal cleavage/methylation domain-containing protein